VGRRGEVSGRSIAFGLDPFSEAAVLGTMALVLLTWLVVITFFEGVKEVEEGLLWNLEGYVVVGDIWECSS